MNAPTRRTDPAAALLEELEELREENRYLRGLLCPVMVFPARLKLTPFEHRLLAALAAVGTGYASVERLMASLYLGAGREEPEYHSVVVYVCRLRKKLRAAGVDVAIENLPGLGWRIVPGGIARLEAMVAEEAGRDG